MDPLWISVLLFGTAMYAVGIAGMAYFGPLDFKLTLRMAFALGFSSTVPYETICPFYRGWS